MGISKGGTEAYLAAAVDPRIAAAVPIIGVQGFRWALDNNQWQARVGMFAPPVDEAARDARRACRCRVRPPLLRSRCARDLRRLRRRSMLALIAPRPVLVINGDSDARTPLAGVQEAVAAARSTYIRMGAGEKLGLYLQPNAGHVVTRVAELVMADWFVKMACALT